MNDLEEIFPIWDKVSCSPRTKLSIANPSFDLIVRTNYLSWWGCAVGPYYFVHINARCLSSLKDGDMWACPNIITTVFSSSRKQGKACVMSRPAPATLTKLGYLSRLARNDPKMVGYQGFVIKRTLVYLNALPRRACHIRSACFLL